MTLAATTSEIDLASMVQHKLSEEKFHKIKSVVETPSSLVRFNPLQPFRKTWDILLSFLLAFNLIEIPFVVGFSLLQGIESGIFWLNRIVDMIFIGDIILNFETGIYAGEKIIMNRSTVRRCYLQSWFALDVISSMPLDLIASLILLSGNGSSGALLSTEGPKIFDELTVVQFLQLFRVLKLLKTFKVYDTFEKALVFRYEDIGILRFLIFIMLSLHWSACIFSWIDENICLQGDEYSSFVSAGLEDENRKTKYIAAFYWALATMTTIGFGDISAKCSATRTFSLVVMLVSSVVYAYGLSYVMEVMRNKRKAESEFRDLMDLVNKYMAFRKIPSDLREEIRKFFNYISESDAKKNELLSERVILEELSPELRVAVLCHVNSGLLEKIPLFNEIQECIGQSRSILQEMVLHMRSQVFRPLESVLKEGSAGNELFFVTSGTCVQIKWNAITVNVLTEGEYYGECGFLYSCPRPSKSEIFNVTTDGLGDVTSESKLTSNERGFASEGNVLSAALNEASKKNFFGSELDFLDEKKISDGGSLSQHNSIRAPKRHTYATPNSTKDDSMQPQRHSLCLTEMNLSSNNQPVLPRKLYLQRYSLVTQSYADLRYVTRELFDEIVKSLPRHKQVRVQKLMLNRYEELNRLDEMRDRELEQLYPHIKEEFKASHADEVEEGDEELDWRMQEMDFVEEEVNEATKDIRDGNAVTTVARRGSIKNTLPARRPTILSRNPSLGMLVSPRKRPPPIVTSPPALNKTHPPRRRASRTATKRQATPRKEQPKELVSMMTPRKKDRMFLKLPSGVLGSHDNSISDVIKREHITVSSPTIYQNSVPTLAVVHSSNVRAFERALSIAGTVSESNANENYSVNSDLDAQSIKTFSDFDMADGISDLDDRSPHSSSKVATSSKENRDDNNAINRVETIEKNLHRLFSHISELKEQLSVQKGLGALSEGDESDMSKSVTDEEGEQGNCHGSLSSEILDSSGLALSTLSTTPTATEIASPDSV